MLMPHKVTIDNVIYHADNILDAEANKILTEVYGALWCEAYYDCFNDDIRNFAKPLADKMSRLNDLLKFKE
jgi:hypothetical protein